MPCELRLMICVWYGLDGADDLVGEDLRLDAVLLAHLEVREDRRAGAAHLALVVVVDLEQAVGALDDLHRRQHARRLERDVGDAVDRDAGRDLDEQRRLARHRQEAARGLADEGGQLRLQRIEERVAAEGRGRHDGRDGVASRSARAQSYTSC